MSKYINNDDTLHIVTYNIMTPVPPPIRHYGQSERSERVKVVLKKIEDDYQFVDVVILNEVIAPSVQSTIHQDMHELGFVYRTQKLTDILSVSGGVLIYSKYEITQQETSTFGNKCTGVDCFAAKGVVYARILKNNRPYNIFGTHMQAWPHIKSQRVRDAQIDQTYKFIHSLNIAKNEPVLFCGDMNIDLYMNNDHLKHLLFQLKMDMPEIHPDSHPFTVDPKENKMVGNDDPYEYKSEEWPQGCMEIYYDTLHCPCCPAEWIDYTFYSREHLLPIQSFMTSIKAKVPLFEMNINVSKKVFIQDVSDHFPVLGHFEFPSPAATAENRNHNTSLQRTVNKNSECLSSNSYNVVLLVLLVVTCVFLFLAGVYIVYNNYYIPKNYIKHRFVIANNKIRKTRLK